MQEIINHVEEKKLDINELEGAILVNSGSYIVYRSDYLDNIGFLKPQVSHIGEGVTSLRTRGILTCAAVAWSNQNNYVLIHARMPESLERLFPVLWKTSIKKAGGSSPLEVYLFKDFFADPYEQILENFMKKNEINFDLQHIHGSLMGCGGGSCEIGPDVLDFKGYDVDWYGQKPKFGFSTGATLLRALILKENAIVGLHDSNLGNLV